jgi:Uma2 family endonuclease
MKTTIARIGPRDHGRAITDQDLRSADLAGGYKYEIIEGRLYVSYQPDAPTDWIEKWLYSKVLLYAVSHVRVINYLTDKARIFIPGIAETTIPEPDFAAYNDFPIDLPIDDMCWEDTSPFLVGEVISSSDPDKELIRNVKLYLQIPTIKEYWILDPRGDAEHPRLLVYRKRGRRWQSVIEVGYGETYTTKILPGFQLLIDPRR